jgi:hypothetical protein
MSILVDENYQAIGSRNYWTGRNLPTPSKCWSMAANIVAGVYPG